MKGKLTIVKREDRLEMRRTEPVHDDLRRLMKSVNQTLERRYPDADERRAVRQRIAQELAG